MPKGGSNAEKGKCEPEEAGLMVFSGRSLNLYLICHEPVQKFSAPTLCHAMGKEFQLNRFFGGNLRQKTHSGPFGPTGRRINM